MDVNTQRPDCIITTVGTVPKVVYFTEIQGKESETKIYHNLFITLFLGSKAEIMLVKQPFYIQTKLYIDYIEKNHLWSFFLFNLCIFGIQL